MAAYNPKGFLAFQTKLDELKVDQFVGDRDCLRAWQNALHHPLTNDKDIETHVEQVKQEIKTFFENMLAGTWAEGIGEAGLAQFKADNERLKAEYPEQYAAIMA